MNAREQQARSDAPNSARENDAGSPGCMHAVDAVIQAHYGTGVDALATIYALHIQRLDELQQKHPEFFDPQEVAHREIGRELLTRKILS